MIIVYNNNYNQKKKTTHKYHLGWRQLKLINGFQNGKQQQQSHKWAMDGLIIIHKEYNEKKGNNNKHYEWKKNEKQREP